MTLDRITVNPQVMNGQPCIRGMRLTVRRVLQAVAIYADRRELISEYPELEDEDIKQALEFAARNLDDAVLRVSPETPLARSIAWYVFSIHTYAYANHLDHR